uniref:Galectin n=1 Tax=Parascaris univalens TaxID=6257 RepID=A0A914ZYS3_PARUN
MVVDGVVEMFMAMWAHYDDRISAGNLRLIHVPDFTIALRPLNRHHILSQDGHISDVGNILLVRFSVDDDYSFNVEHTAAGDALYGYQRGNFLKDRIFLKVSSQEMETHVWIGRQVCVGMLRANGRVRFVSSCSGSPPLHCRHGMTQCLSKSFRDCCQRSKLNII